MRTSLLSIRKLARRSSVSLLALGLFALLWSPMSASCSQRDDGGDTIVLPEYIDADELNRFYRWLGSSEESVLNRADGPWRRRHLNGPGIGSGQFTELLTQIITQTRLESARFWVDPAKSELLIEHLFDASTTDATTSILQVSKFGGDQQRRVVEAGRVGACFARKYVRETGLVYLTVSEIVLPANSSSADLDVQVRDDYLECLYKVYLFHLGFDSAFTIPREEILRRVSSGQLWVNYWGYIPLRILYLEELDGLIGLPIPEVKKRLRLHPNANQNIK